jgi:TP901 family phage tail tape measure protein
MAQLPAAGIMLVAEGITQWLNQINTANTAMTNFATSTTNAANQVNNIPTTGINNTGKAIDNLGNHAANAQAKAGVFQEVWTGALRQVGGFATQKMMEAGGAILKFATDIPAKAGEFQGKFYQILAVGGEEVAKNEDAIRKLIIKVGKELPISTNDAADAYANLIKGGFDPATLAAGTFTDTIQFALGAHLDLAQAADLVAKQVGSFVPAGASAAEQAKFAAEAMDIMTQVANTSTTDVAGLTAGLLQAGGTAKGVGLEYKDFAMTMGAISSAFGSSSEAGTSFKNFLVRLNPSTKAAQEAMQKLGLFSMDTSKMMTFLTDQGVKPLGTDLGTLTEQVAKYLKESQGLSKAEVAKSITENFGSSAFYDAKGNLKSMTEVAAILGDSLKNLTNEQKSQALQQIFGNDAMNAAVKLADLGAAGMEDFAAKMAKANGVQKQYDAAMKGATFASDNFDGTLEAIQITLGTYILPYIEQFYTALNNVASSFLTLFDDKKSLADIIPPGVVDALQPLVDMFEDVKKEGMAMWVDISAIFADLQKVFEVTGQDYGIQWADTFKLIFQIVRLVMLATLRSISDTIKGIRVILENPGVQFALVTIQNAFRVMYEVVAGIVETLIAVFNGDFGKIPAILDAHLAAITDIFNKFDVYFYAQWDALVAYLGGVWDEIYNTIMGQIELIIIDIGAWIMGVKNTIINGWNAVVAGVMYILDNFWSLVAQYWLNFAFNLGRSLRLIYDLTLLSFKLTWDGVVWIFTNAIPAIDKALINLWNDLSLWLNTTKIAITKAFADGWFAVVKMFENAWPDTQKALAKFGISFTGWIAGVWKDAQTAFASLWDAKSIGENVGDGILEGLKANASKILKYISDLAQGILNEFLAGLRKETKSDTTTPTPVTTTPPKTATTAIDAKVETITKSLGATATAAAFGAARAMVNNTYNYSNATAYNLGVNTTATAGDTIQSFAIMGALAS